ncbi:hypothetical protein LTR56_002335 [Elasticomyces elasticus]|nr:hypothetical protein LTR56_002335 [Elasticomyces elasticus]KAK3665899.1 hypothetical protein LTR22_003218 [Elasticomyces elasticus]KAK4929371.1 hypothetical protein LTR49_003975 [Elasticomyces elasticus]KAK5764660.1 hypothetical protein LTS12_005161 [Elasticomyces elasticus]
MLNATYAGALAHSDADGGGVRGYWSLLVLQHLMECIAEHEAKFREDKSEQVDRHIHSFTPQPFRQNACHVLSTEERHQRDAALTEEDRTIALDPAKRFLPCHYFDYIGGSDTGGWIAIMLGRLRMTVPDCLDEYGRLCARVFGQPRTFTQLRLPFIKRSKYSSKHLQEVFEDIICRRGEEESYGQQPRYPVADNVCKCFVTSMISDRRNDLLNVSKPFIIRSYPCMRKDQYQWRMEMSRSDTWSRNSLLRTRSNTGPLQHQENEETEPIALNPGPAHDFEIWEVARAASAAPYYFDPIKIYHSGGTGTYLFETVGFGAPSNPTNYGLSEILNENEHIGCVVSIGTATGDRDNQFLDQEKDFIVDKLKRQMNTVNTFENEQRAGQTSSLANASQYFRLNPDEEAYHLDIELDEWLPRKTRRGELSGTRTIRGMRDLFNKWHADNPDVREYFERCAEQLVRRRRHRLADTGRWVRFADGCQYRCNYARCPKEERLWANGDEFVKHLQADHGVWDEATIQEEMLMSYQRNYYKYKAAGDAGAVAVYTEAIYHSDRASVKPVPSDNTLDNIVASSDIDLIHITLDKQFETVATGSWSWLWELKELGYSNFDIAALLLERHRERPWIFFEPWILTSSLPDREFHIVRCVHQYEHPAKDGVIPSLEEGRNTGDNANNMRSAVASLCGLGGVVPFGDTTTEDLGKFIYFLDDSSAIITYGEPGRDNDAVLDRMVQAMERFCTALDIVQRANACCDTFTVLVTLRRVSGPNFAELRTISIGDALDFLTCLKDADSGNPDSLETCRILANGLLECLEGFSLAPALCICALAVQFLTLGLVSYCQAHVGGLEMFLIEQKVQRVELGGVLSRTRTSSEREYSEPSIHFELQRLTCLDGMLGAPVMVFTRGDQRVPPPERLDVLATAEALLDTWGPGGMVMDKNGGGRVHMLNIRGGKIYPYRYLRTDYRWCHWSLDAGLQGTTNGVTFRTNEKMLVGAAVEVNPACRCTEQECLAKCQNHYLPLNTVAPHMRQQAMEYGVQAGQYGMLTFNNVLEKIPGVSLKEILLDRLQKGQDHSSFLASSSGLQVSFCSGLARRVRMRDLLAELLPVFVQRDLIPNRSWRRLEDHYHITEELAHGDIRDVLRLMYADDPACFQDFWLLAFGLTRLLRDTGLDLSNDTFRVAIIPSAADEPLRRVSFDAGKLHCWTKALRDTDTCATFAYFTLSCLQVGGRGCRNRERSWHREVLLLQTEVLRSLSGHTPSTVSEPWILEHGTSYRLGSPDADARFNLLAQVVRRRPTEDPQLLVKETLTPAWAWKRLQQKRHLHLQERQGPSDVVVRAFMTSIDTTRFSFA